MNVLKFGTPLVVILVGAWWMHALVPVAICVGVALLFFTVWISIAYLAITGRIKPVHEMPGANTLSEERQPREWGELENQIIKVFSSGSEDAYQAVMLRFLVAINAVDAGQETYSRDLINPISKKMLYEYRRRTGSLYFEHYDERTSITGPEVLRRLSDEERLHFMEFGSGRDRRNIGKTKTTAETYDYPSTAEMTQRLRR